ncbi:hypothetical protein AwDysgo_03920 [Bacteroidales bacterium]|nr:hypothetical protein AwDysgo_03920 [Bacteroidales bacterium]
MLSKEFLTKKFPHLKPSDKGSFALSLMEDYKVQDLPMVQDGIYLCLVSEKDIFAMQDLGQALGSISIYAPYAREDTPLLEVLRTISIEKKMLLPVVDEKGRYLGVITAGILRDKLAEMTNAISNGSIIALELNSQDYDLSNIVHLAESNNAKILSLFTYPIADTAKMVVLLKIDLEDISAVLRSLERFNYSILYYFQKEKLIDDNQRKSLDELMYYLDI